MEEPEAAVNRGEDSAGASENSVRETRTASFPARGGTSWRTINRRIPSWRSRGLNGACACCSDESDLPGVLQGMAEAGRELLLFETTGIADAADMLAQAGFNPPTVHPLPASLNVAVIARR